MNTLIINLNIDSFNKKIITDNIFKCGIINFVSNKYYTSRYKENKEEDKNNENDDDDDDESVDGNLYKDKQKQNQFKYKAESRHVNASLNLNNDESMISCTFQNFFLIRGVIRSFQFIQSLNIRYVDIKKSDILFILKHCRKLKNFKLIIPSDSYFEMGDGSILYYNSNLSNLNDEFDVVSDPVTISSSLKYLKISVEVEKKNKHKNYVAFTDINYILHEIKNKIKKIVLVGIGHLQGLNFPDITSTLTLENCHFTSNCFITTTSIRRIRIINNYSFRDMTFIYTNMVRSIQFIGKFKHCFVWEDTIISKNEYSKIDDYNIIEYATFTTDDINKISASSCMGHIVNEIEKLFT